MVDGPILAFLIVSWLTTSVAVWYNASTHDANARLWSGFTLLTGIFGAVVYLLVLTADPDGPDGTPLVTPGAGTDFPGTRSRNAYEHRQARQEELVEALESHLQSTGGSDEEEIREALYEDHPVGFDAPGAWWIEFVEPTLEHRDDVEKRGDTYHLAS